MAGPFVVATLMALAQAQDSTMWGIQHILGSARLREEQNDWEGAIAKIGEAEVALAAWRAQLKAKSSARAPAAAPVERPQPIEFKVEVKHTPEKCTRRSIDGSTLRVHYVAKQLHSDGENGKVVASSFHGGSMPHKVVLGSAGADVIEGWNRGLLDMCVGERRRLFVPFTMAYGAAGAKNVPPYANLRFDIELVELSGATTDDLEEKEDL